eukprot:GHUV01009988.1.p1 GENE.GHUV01009988.1~~GHUV01009988.1.p1  ORF type:complete len:177 (+),score=58.56 GHUV01009988.1:189-719(+)
MSDRVKAVQDRIDEVERKVRDLEKKDDDLSRRERVALQEQLTELRKKKNMLLQLQGPTGTEEEATGTRAGASDLQVVVPKVMLKCRGAGAPLDLLVELHKGRLNIPSIEKVLAARKLQLLSINQAVPAVDDKGYTDRKFNDNDELTAEVSLKPGVKMATAYSSVSQSWWRRLIPPV